MIRFLAMAAAAGLLSAPAWSHPGGLNGEGCHNNRSTGEYHCHGGGGGSPSAGKISGGKSGKKKRRRR